MILFDLSYFSHRIIWPNKEQVIENPNFFAHLITMQILQFAKKLGASKTNPFVICLDSTNWRKDYYEQNKVKFPELANESYKGHRVKDDTIPWDTINETIDNVCASFKQYSDFYVMKVAKAEADDIIAILAKRFKSKQSIWVLSPDKDFVQLQDTNVKIFDPLKNAFKPEQDIEMFMKIHIMIGDKSDNIPAVRARLGEKTAIKILKDLDTLLATDPIMREKYEFNKNLIDFTMIPEYIEDTIIAEFETQAFSYNPSGLMKIFMKYGMSKISEDIGAFRLPDKEMKTTINQFFITHKRNVEVSRNSLEDFFN
jgi:5'-3' exonuclease